MAMTNAQIAALYQVTFPINFVLNGDTVHQGFYKHIQEIDRIYGLLAGLERSKVTTSDLVAMLRQYVTASDLTAILGQYVKTSDLTAMLSQFAVGNLSNYVTVTDFNNHVNSSNPHPNLDLANTKGTIPTSRVTGNWDLSRVTGKLGVGNIDMAGLISYLEGDTGFVNWINSLIQSLMPSGGNVLDQSGRNSISVTVTTLDLSDMKNIVSGSSTAYWENALGYSGQSMQFAADIGSGKFQRVKGTATVTLPTAYQSANAYISYSADLPSGSTYYQNGVYNVSTQAAAKPKIDFTPISGSQFKLEADFIAIGLSTSVVPSDGTYNMSVDWTAKGMTA